MTTPVLTIRAVGDICPAAVSGDPFEDVASLLEADVLFGNLECCLTTRGDAAVKNAVFKADPASVDYLAPFDILCLANNHVLDFGPEGLEDTIGALEAAGRTYVGAGRNAPDASATRWIEAAGVRVAVVATADASGGAADRASVSVLSIRALAERVRQVREQADVVIASYHGGIELDTTPSPSVVRGLRELVDAGADVVLGHHPHVLQPAERYRGGVIAYSLGNFVFDNRRYGDLADLAATTAVFEARVPLAPRGAREPSYSFFPARIGDNNRPRAVSGAASGAFFEHMEALERRLAEVDGGAVDTQRLENMTRELHTKSLRTILRYGVRHLGDFTLKELVVGAGLAVRSMFRRGTRR